jgi:hypothetical protein
MANPLDQCLANPLTPIIVGGPICIPGPDLDCNSSISICPCPPSITPPPSSSKCVNDLTNSPWPPPPPADVGCNPFNVSVTNRQDETASNTISLKGKVNYVGGDPCLPQLDLELLTSPNFFAGGGAPIVRGYGVTLYGKTPSVGPNCNYENPQQFFANEPYAVTFIPKENNEICPQPAGCELQKVYSRAAARFNIIGPILGKIVGRTASQSIMIENEEITYAWRYTWTPGNCVESGNTCIGGCPVELPNESSADLRGAQSDTCWNIKENLSDPFSSSPQLNPGVHLKTAVKLGLKPQPIAYDTLVLIYGLVPDWNSGNNCNCEINWFFDVPNALAGECKDPEEDEALQATSLLPSRKISSAGMFFGVDVYENRV